jgi:hypothetical protein
MAAQSTGLSLNETFKTYLTYTLPSNLADHKSNTPS